MKSQLSFLLLICTLLSSTAYAADPQIGGSDSFEPTGLTSMDDFSSRTKEIMKVAASSDRFEENIVLINQIDGPGKRAYAYAEQSGGTGNFIAIVQDATAHSATALVFQSGSNARAIVYQH